MPRPRQHATSADRQKAYTARKRLVRITLRASTVATLDRIAKAIDSPRAELVAAMIEFAAADPRFGEAEFRTSYDARRDGPTKRIDVALPEGCKLEKWELPTAIQFALANRQWARFGV